MNKPISIILLSILLFVLAAYPAYAAVVTVAEYPYGAGDSSWTGSYDMTVPHPAATAVVSAYYVAFQPIFNDTLLTGLDLMMYKEGSPVGFIRSQLYATSGTYGSTAVPTGAALATSNDIEMSSLGVTPGAYVRFTFDGSYALYAGVTYALSVEEVNETTCDTTNGPRCYYDQAGSYGGNGGYYISGGWTSLPSLDDDLCFVVYGEGGDAVTYMGYNIYITQTVTNVTAVVNGTEVSFNNTAVSAGDVQADGVVTVSGAVTNNFNNTAVTAGDVQANGAVTANGTVTVNASITNSFNNTAVSASGDITAGAVTAGDVTAAGEVTMAGDLSVNGTFENATLTYLTSTAVSGDANVYFLIAFIGLAVLLTFYNKVPLLNFLVGVVGISFIMLTIAKTDLPFWPYSSVLLALTSLICMLSGGFKMRNS